MTSETVREGLTHLCGLLAVITALNVRCITVLQQHTGPAVWAY